MRNNKWFLPVLMLFAGAVICFVFPKYIFHANAWLLSGGGDGLKNYFTPAWFVAHNSGAHFSGMHYPYGDNLVFADAQPSLSWILQFINSTLFPIAGYTVGILHICIFFSLWLSVYFIYRIARHYGLPYWYAGIAALLITGMSPQLERIGGHFSLAYTCFIPAMWWLAIRWRTSNYSIKRTLGLILFILFFACIHMYYLLTAAFFFGTWAVVAYFRKKMCARAWLAHACIILIPGIITLLFTHVGSAEDRTTAPYGFFDYKATFQSVFLARQVPVLQWLHDRFHTPYPDAEGYAYVGMFGFIVLVLSVVLFVKRVIRKKGLRHTLFPLPSDLDIYLFAATCVLLFSMTIPFGFFPPGSIDRIPLINQFRSPGRFAWMFYYVFLMYGFVLVYYFFRGHNKYSVILARSILVIVLFIPTRENWLLLKDKKAHYGDFNKPNIFNGKSTTFIDALHYAGTEPHAFQAILYIPFYHQGSEKLYVDRTLGDLSSFEIAFQTGLPLIDAMMSRTSIGQTLHVAQIVSHPAIDKTDLPPLNDKDILLVVNPELLRPTERYLIDRSRYICDWFHLKCYALPVSALQNTQEPLKQYFETYRDSLRAFAGGAYYGPDSISVFYRNSFEDRTSPDPFMGKGSLYSEKQAQFLLDTIPIHTDVPIWFELSCWTKAYRQTSAFPYINIDMIDEQGRRYKVQSVTSKLSTDVIGKWVRGSENFEITPQCRALILYTSLDKWINMDELVLRHTAFDVFYGIAGDSAFIYNNYPVGLEAGAEKEQ